MPSIRILLVDDHEVVRLGLRAMLELEPDLRVVGEAADGAEVAALTDRLHPDVAILDVRMGAVDGIQACRELKAARPECAVLLLTSFGTEQAVLAGLMAGASGFLLKNTARAELLRAIRAVAAGQSLLDPAVTRQVTEKLVELATRAESPELAGLSARERQVLTLVARGKTNREIAAELVIAEITARNHVSHILEKLGLSRRAEAAALAARLGLLGDRDA